MKLRNYEKRGIILFLIFLFILVVVFIVIYSFFYKIDSYYLIRGVVFRDDLLEVVVDSYEKKVLYQNGFVYIDGKKYNYDIKNVLDDALFKDEVGYSVIYIECDLNNEKENDIVDLIFLKEKIRLVEIFKLIWKGD